MKKHLTILAVACVAALQAAQTQTLPSDRESLNAAIRPFLDSLRVDPSEDDLGTLRLVSVFPASRATAGQAEPFETSGAFRSFVPENPNLTGGVTEPIAILGGTRIALEGAYLKGTTEVSLTVNYTFKSKVETSPDGTGMIRQTLELTALPGEEITSGFVEAIIWDVTADEPIDIGRPVYRHTSIYRGHRHENHATHMLRDADGVLSPIDFTEGSDRTFAMFKGGRMGEFVYAIRTMKYPREALEQGTGGVAHVEMIVTARGKVKDVGFMIEPDPVFRNEALRLARKSSGKWIPATRNGENIDDYKVMNIQFSPEYAPQW